MFSKECSIVYDTEARPVQSYLRYDGSILAIDAVNDGTGCSSADKRGVIRAQDGNTSTRLNQVVIRATAK